MTAPLPVFVNEHRVELGAGGTAVAAVAVFDATLAGKIDSGDAYITDGRGIRIAPDQPVHAGAILRVVVSSRRNKDEADAHP